MHIFRTIVFVLGLVVMAFFASTGLDGELPSWIGGVAWAILGVYTTVSFYMQVHYEDNMRMMTNLIQELLKSDGVSKLSEVTVGLNISDEEEKNA